MSWHECIDCGKKFWRKDDEDWKVRCFRCWKASKGNSSPNEFEFLKQENDRLRDRIEELQRMEADLKNLFKHINFLIFACHPDRCPGREKTAHEVMVWLNLKREEINKGK